MIKKKTLNMLTRIAKTYLKELSINDYMGGDPEADDFYGVIDYIIDCFGKDVVWQDKYDHFWLKPFNLHFDIHTGVSKLAIVFKELNAVIKIPFNGQWVYPDIDDTDWESDNIDWSEIEQEFIAFTRGSSYEGSEWNYIAGEEAIYAELEKIGNGYEKLYLPNELLYLTPFNYPIYIQEKVQTALNADDSKASTPESRLIAAASSSEGLHSRIRNTTWLGSIIDHHGINFFSAFDAFVSSAEGEKFTRDLHGNNIGYTTDGAPVILDYAGWHDDI